MPQIQIFEKLPTFGDKLAGVLAQQGTNILGAAKERKEQKTYQSALSVLNDPNASALQKVAAFGTLPEKHKKGTERAYAEVLGKQAENEANQTQFEKEFPQGTQPDQTGDSENIKPSTANPENFKGSQGVTTGNQGEANPGQAGLGEGNVEAPTKKSIAERKSTLRNQSAFAGHKNPLLNQKGQQAKAELKEIERQEDIFREERNEAHKESSEFDKNLGESAKRAKQSIEVVKDIRKNFASGKVKPGNPASFFKGLGVIGEKLSQATKNAEEGGIDAATPFLLEGWKEVFGTRLSDADLKVLQDKLPAIGKSLEANQAVLDIIEKYAKPNILRAEIGREIKDQNGGYRPRNFADQVEKEFDRRTEATKPVRIKGPDGFIYEIPQDQAEKALTIGKGTPA
jgi:hypothetical protein